MESGVELAIVWLDDDELELRIRASNGRFAGEAHVYEVHGALRELAEKLRGFPSSAADSRDCALGTFDPKFAGGGVRLRFHCTDGAGHAVVETTIRTDAHYHAGVSETAEFAIAIEAGAVDAFVAELNEMRLAVGAAARLCGSR